jgi:hypothetical protein
MSTTSAPTLSLYFPLWGATFDSDEVGAIGPGVVAYVPYPDEWRSIQKTDVWMAQWRSDAGRVEGPTPPCCIVVFATLTEGESMEAAVARAGARLRRSARTAVTALRLYRSGWFLQPEQAFSVYYAPSLSPSVLRAPGPYRQIFVSGRVHLPVTPYALRLADLTRQLDRPGPIAAAWELLQAYQRTGGNTSVEIALEGLHLSYGFQLRPASRAGNLFTALDAMVGGMSAWKVGGVPVKPRGYARRIEAALRTARSPAFHDDPLEAARWLHHDRGGRGLRNALAHGTGTAVEAAVADAIDRLQDIVRSLLWQYLRLSAVWARRDHAVAARIGISRDAPLAAAYVTVLETESRHPGTIQDLLQAAL